MRLRIRTLLLTVAMLCFMTSTASACIYIPILDPFCWLFGCCGNYGGGAYGGYGYPGYGQGGYGYGYGYGMAPANPQAVHRCIDDWLGWGYLRNQEGTLGHYPGRPPGCYQPSYPGLMSPTPAAPIAGFNAPMVAPYCPMVPPPLRLPIPPIFNPCWNPCVPQYAPQPVVQYQPRPQYRWNPAPVVNNWAMPCAPQPIYAPPVQQWQMQMNDPCCDPCGDPCCGDGIEMSYGGGMMPGMQYHEMPSDSGCCGSDSVYQQYEQPGVAPTVPQSTMMMSPGTMMLSRQRTFNGSSAFSNSGFNTARQQYGRPVWQTSVTGLAALRPGTPVASGYQNSFYGSQPSANYAYATQFVPTLQPTAWRPMTTTSVPVVSQMPRQVAAMPMQMAMPMPTQHQYGMNSINIPSQPRTAYANPMMMGDVTGDHEFSSMNAAAFPVTPNSFNGRQPIRQAVYSQPVPTTPTRTVSTRQYPNSVQ